MKKVFLENWQTLNIGHGLSIAFNAARYNLKTNKKLKPQIEVQTAPNIRVQRQKVFDRMQDQGELVEMPIGDLVGELKKPCKIDFNQIQGLKIDLKSRPQTLCVHERRIEDRKECLGNTCGILTIRKILNTDHGTRSLMGVEIEIMNLDGIRLTVT
jgi:hypothetical protein